MNERIDGMKPDASAPARSPGRTGPRISDCRHRRFGRRPGGLRAVLYAHAPDTGLAFVVIQHLSPPHPSILPEIIQRFTAMPVVQVTDGIEVKPNHVYVIPPGSDLALQDGHLALLTPETGARGPPADRPVLPLIGPGSRRGAIGIVLSGT
jgi:two-component system, chemotaxis family, CheB/CheR fusion protein